MRTAFCFTSFLVCAAAAGCASTVPQSVAQRSALEARGTSDLGCDGLWLTKLGGDTKPDALSGATASEWSVDGCGKTAPYLVTCSQPGGLRATAWQCSARADGPVTDSALPQ